MEIIKYKLHEFVPKNSRVCVFINKLKHLLYKMKSAWNI